MMMMTENLHFSIINFIHLKTPQEKRHMSHDLIKDMCLFFRGVFIYFTGDII